MASILNVWPVLSAATPDADGQETLLKMEGQFQAAVDKLCTAGTQTGSSLEYLSFVLSFVRGGGAQRGSLCVFGARRDATSATPIEFNSGQ